MDEMVRNLIAYSEWANAVFFHAWGKSPARDHEEMRTRVAHILGVQKAFLSILRGEQLESPPDEPPPTFAELKADAQTTNSALNSLTATLDSEELSRMVQVPWFPDPPCVVTVREALTQIAMHAQHHRGQCMTRLKDFGGEPKNVDWIIWLWLKKPAPRWE